MAAQKGNKYAEKWNEETVLSKLDEINQHITLNPEDYTLIGVLVECGLYFEWWSHMTKKFINNKEVSHTIKQIEQRLESRIVQNTLNGIIKSNPMAIFYLKNKHGYKDVQERKIDSNQKRLVINVVQDDEEE